MAYPSEPISALRRQHDELAAESEKSHPDPSSLKLEGDTVDPIIFNVKLLGYFPTADWKDDPTMPDFCSYHKYRIGYYCVADFDLRDAVDSIMPLTAVINAGDGDCNTGYWGGIFNREVEDHQCVAQIISSGDMETTVEAETSVSFADYSASALKFPVYKEGSDDEEDYFGGLSPGFCKTQFEKLLGVAMHTIMTARREWKMLPVSLTRKNIGNIH